jgi:MinD-like ATPase involved in chromosome partitioning or flagellar assembly
MATIISVHSFRGGTGKSNTLANLAALFALRGLRVGVIDTDIQSPGIHILFGFDHSRLAHSLNDYLWGKCDVTAAAYDVTDAVAGATGALFLIPASIKAGEITRVLRQGYDVGLLNDGFQQLIRRLQLDVLMIDTHPGLNEETLLSIAISDALVMVMRPDAQDYEGTGVAIQVARQLDVPRLCLIVNKTPPAFGLQAVGERVKAAYGCEVIAVLPHADEMMTLASAGLFVLRHPQHPITESLRRVCEVLIPAQKT